MTYHVIYHFSPLTHINHLIFANTYLLGVLLALATAKSVLAMVLPASAYIGYALWLSNGWRGLPFALWVGGLAVGAWWSVSAAGAPLAECQAWEVLLIALLGLVLGSLLLQVLAHRLFEERQAPMSLCHGFAAAPVLEYHALLLRLGLGGESLRGVYERLADAQRSQRLAALSRPLLAELAGERS